MFWFELDPDPPGGTALLIQHYCQHKRKQFIYLKEKKDFFL